MAEVVSLWEGWGRKEEEGPREREYKRTNYFKCLFVVERETESASGGGAERERETPRLK